MLEQLSLRWNEFQQKTVIQLMDGEKGIVLEGVKGRNNEVHYSSSWIHVEEQEKEDMADFVSKWMEELGDGWKDVMDDLSAFRDLSIALNLEKVFYSVKEEMDEEKEETDKEKEEKDLGSEVINREEENEVVADEDTNENGPDAVVTAVDDIRNKTSRKRFKSAKLNLSFPS